MTELLSWRGLLFRAFQYGTSERTQVMPGAQAYTALSDCFEGLKHRKILSPLIYMHVCHPPVRVARDAPDSAYVLTQEIVTDWSPVPRGQVEEIMNATRIAMVEQRLYHGPMKEFTKESKTWKQTELLIERLEKVFSDRYSKRELMHSGSFSRHRHSG